MRGKPWRHGAFKQHALNDFCALHHAFAIVQGEGGNSSVVMATNAVLAQNAGDVAMVGDRVLGTDFCFLWLGKFDFATRWRSGGDGWKASRNEGFHCIEQVGVTRGVEGVIGTELVVECAAINHGPSGVQEKELGGGPSLKGGGQRFISVMNPWRADAVFVHQTEHVFHLIFGEWVHDDHPDITFLQVVLKGSESRDIAFADRTGGACEGNDGPDEWGWCGESDGFAAEGLDGEVGDLASYRDFCGVLNDGSRGDGGGSGRRSRGE